MEYTIQKLSNLAKVSTRTLRYYDEIGILKPARINSSGYRIYGENEINILQQILFYKSLGVRLDRIKELINSPNFDEVKALEEHMDKLLDKRKEIDMLITNVKKTIANRKGEIKMTNKEKFEAFKKDIIDENEEKYGNEIREKYGDKYVEKSNEKLMGMSKEKYDEWQKLSDEIINTLNEAFETGNPAGEIAQKAAKLHKEWLSFTWPTYSKKAHIALAQMYVDDERFTNFYDKKQAGLTKFLRDAILIYTEK